MLPHLFATLPTYGLIKAVAFLLGLWCAWKLSRRAGLDPLAVLRLGVYCLLAAALGGRLLGLVQSSARFLQRPAELLQAETWRPAGAFYGGLLAGILTTIVYLRHHKLPGLETADVIAPSLALGQSIVRMGCFAAGCCWGKETQLPWAVTFTNPAAHRLTGVPLGIPLHPTQLYQSLAQAIFFVVLWRRFQRRHRPGAILGLYFVLEGVSRFLVDFVRASASPNPFGWILTDMQWLAAALAGAGMVLLRPATVFPDLLQPRWRESS